MIEELYKGQFYLLLDAPVWDEPIPTEALGVWGWSDPIIDPDTDEQIGATPVHPTWRQLEGRVLGPIRWNLAGTQAIARLTKLPPMATAGQQLVAIAIARNDITLLSHDEAAAIVADASWVEAVA